MGNEVIEKLRRRQFTTEFKVGAVKMVRDQRLDRAEVGRRLEIEPRLIKKWERAYDAGKFNLGEIKRVVSPEQQEISKLRAELSRVRMENAILKNRPRACPPPICVETQGGYTGGAPGQWPSAFWRRMSPLKNLAQGKLRTQLWWHLV